MDRFGAVRRDAPRHKVLRCSMVPALALKDVVKTLMCEGAGNVMPAAVLRDYGRRKMNLRMKVHRPREAERSVQQRCEHHARLQTMIMRPTPRHNRSVVRLLSSRRKGVAASPHETVRDLSATQRRSRRARRLCVTVQYEQKCSSTTPSTGFTSNRAMRRMAGCDTCGAGCCTAARAATNQFAQQTAKMSYVLAAPLPWSMPRRPPA